MVSSLRNSLHRRTHKERSQPIERQKLGLLEKKKDYAARAANYHSKKERLEALRRKAGDRNKDEFYFGMHSSKTERGVHVKYRQNATLSTEIATVLKGQDANYIRTMRKANVRKIEALKRELTTFADLVKSKSLEGQAFIDNWEDLEDGEMDVLERAGVVSSLKGKGKEIEILSSGHIVFVDDEESAWKYEPPARVTSADVVDEDEADEDLGWKKAQKKSKPKVIDDSSKLKDELKEQAKQNRTKLLKELAARLERDQHLRYAEQELEMQRLTMAGKGSHRRIKDKEQVYEGDNDVDEEEFTFRRKNRMPVVELGNEVYKPKVFKWRQERKR